VLIKYDYDVHPDFELVLQRLNEKVVRAGDLGSELSLVNYPDFLLILFLRFTLQILDAVSQFLQENIQGIFDRLVRGNMNTISEAVNEIRSLKYHVIIAFGVVYLHPIGWIFHGKSVFFACENFVIFRQGDSRNYKDRNRNK
jgi:hypothetical protein